MGTPYVSGIKSAFYQNEGDEDKTGAEF